jgi:hypothetical protein
MAATHGATGTELQDFGEDTLRLRDRIRHHWRLRSALLDDLQHSSIPSCARCDVIGLYVSFFR